MLSVSEDECFTHLREAGVKILTTAVPGAEHGPERGELVDMAVPVAFLIGNEGSGVPRDLAAMTDGAITIPCPGPVESLNAAVAASVLLYEASRQRRNSR
jgi:TrmH family RNA methyltransferase